MNKEEEFFLYSYSMIRCGGPGYFGIKKRKGEKVVEIVVTMQEELILLTHV